MSENNITPDAALHAAEQAAADIRSKRDDAAEALKAFEEKRRQLLLEASLGNAQAVKSLKAATAQRDDAAALFDDLGAAIDMAEQRVSECRFAIEEAVAISLLPELRSQAAARQKHYDRARKIMLDLSKEFNAWKQSAPQCRGLIDRLTRLEPVRQSPALAALMQLGGDLRTDANRFAELVAAIFPSDLEWRMKTFIYRPVEREWAESEMELWTCVEDAIAGRISA
jgi:hypothetical protein